MPLHVLRARGDHHARDEYCHARGSDDRAGRGERTAASRKTGRLTRRSAARYMPAMDPHRIAEARSLAYHRVVAERLASEPAILQDARARVRSWLHADPTSHFARAWDDVLQRPVREIVALLTDPGERACELRQSTPFAGVLDPRERWRLWREVGERSRAVR